MYEYTWQIENVDPSTGTMVVIYEHEGVQARYNIHIPPTDVDVGQWVDNYAPKAAWELMKNPINTDHVKIGQSGTNAWEPPKEEPALSETPNINGAWNEEYLRAMIYSVLEEIKESQV